MKRILPSLGWAALALLVLLLAGVVVARALFTRYLHSEAFRRSLGEAAANTLHASRADFSPLEFNGALVYGENFHAARDDGGGFSTLDADQLRASLDWHGLLHHAVQIDELAIQRVEVQPPAPGAAPEEDSIPAPPAPAAAAFPPEHPGWRVDLRKAAIAELDWQWSADPPGGITGAALALTPAGQDAWDIDAQGGTLQQYGWPALTIESASMRWQNPILYINSSSLRNGDSRLAVTGSVEARRSVSLHVKADGVDIQPLLTPDWRERLSGRLTGQADVQAPLGRYGVAGDVTITGSAMLADGQLMALPILDQIGLFTQTQRFRRLELTDASAEFTRTPQRLEVRNLVAESAGLIRIEGSYSVENGQIDGAFQIGLTPSTLQWIPGAEDDVFVQSRGGYRWTTVKLTGPAGHPVDDLTPRLAAATGRGIIQGAQGVEGAVKKAAEGALDLLLH